MSTITKIAGKKYREARALRSARRQMQRNINRLTEASFQQALNDHVYKTLLGMMRPDVRATCERLTWERECAAFAKGKAA